MNIGRALQMSPLIACLALVAASSPAADGLPADRSAMQRSGDHAVAGPAAQAATFQNAKEKLSYALGVEWAAGIKWQHMEVDPEWMARGLRDAFADERTALLLTPKELADTLKSYARDRQRGIAHAMHMISAKNEHEGAQFAEQNAKKDGVTTLASGLQYRVLTAGNGPRPGIDDEVEIHYRGTLLDGTEFDSSYSRGEPETAPVRRLIKGWREAMQLMPVGSKWQLYVPPQLAYGKQGAGAIIGPGATLVLDVELLSIKASPAPQKKSQTAVVR